MATQQILRLTHGGDRETRQSWVDLGERYRLSARQMGGVQAGVEEDRKQVGLRKEGWGC